MTMEISFQDIPETKIHEFAQLFPEMSDEEFEALKDDIDENGQKEAVVLYKGDLLDGVHRMGACYQLKRPVKARELGDDESPLEYVLSKNLRRRHLTASQKAMVVARMDSLRDEVEARAKERRQEGAKRGGATAGRGRDKTAESSEEDGDSHVEKTPKARRARDELAQIGDVNGRYVSDAMKLLNTDLDLADDVLSGKLSLSAAMKRLQQEDYRETLLQHGINDEFVKWIMEDRIRLDDYNIGRLAELDKEQQRLLLSIAPKGRTCNVDQMIIRLRMEDSWDEADVSCKRRLEAARAGQEALQQVKESLDVLGISTFSELLEMLASTFYDVLAAKPEATAVEATAGVE